MAEEETGETKPTEEGSPAAETDGDGEPKRGRKGHPHLRLAIALALVAVSGTALAVAEMAAAAPTGGSTVHVMTSQEASEGRTAEEVQADLDQEVEESRMTVRVSSVLAIGSKGERLYVGFENDSGNSWSQRFEVVQDGRTLYSSDVLKPGESVDTVGVPDGIEEGEATVVVHAVDSRGADHGNPVAAQVRVHQASEGGDE